MVRQINNTVNTIILKKKKLTQQSEIFMVNHGKRHNTNIMIWTSNTIGVHFGQYQSVSSYR